MMTEWLKIQYQNKTVYRETWAYLSQHGKIINLFLGKQKK